VRPLDQSQALWARAERVIPLGTQTLSKGPSQFVQGVCPIYLDRGRGSHVWDADGNEYIDYPMALGPVLLGHCDARVDAAIREQLESGITFTMMHRLEVEVAERIVQMCPGVDAVRFAKSGSDALSGAVRAARAHTGRDHLLVCGYHGWHDWYIGTTTRNRGVPKAVQELTSTFRFNDLDDLDRALRAYAGDVAAVVVEPSGSELPRPGYLQELVDRARGAGAVSIFDEVITGFRLAPGGARERYSATPDISCYGKALGNGMPISAVAGSWELMRVFEDIFFSGTHGGEALSLAAARAVLDAIEDGTVLAGIHATGRELLDGMSARVRSHGLSARISVSGEPERTVVTCRGDDHLVVKSWLQQSLANNGILFNGSMFISAAHSADDIGRTLDAFDGALDALVTHADVSTLLEGPPVQAVFRPV
jgi:glutamate-1-semialdehyde aminotransferase